MVHFPFMRWVAGAALAAATFGGAIAQDYPSKPVRIIVPAAAGGATDLIGRLIGQQLSDQWRKPVVVENRPGAGAAIGSDHVAKSAPDGHTLLVSAFSHTVNPALMEKLPYDSIRDFTPIVKMMNFPSVLVVNAGLPITNLKEFIDYARANPKKLVFALGAIGTSQQMAGALLGATARIEFLQVPYKGGGPAMTDLLGGHASFMIESIPTALPHIQSGKIRAIGITSATRSKTLPEVPSIGETAVPGFDVNSWFGLHGPSGLPPRIAQQIHRDVAEILAKPEVVDKLAAMGTQIHVLGPADFAAFVASETARWGKVVREVGIKN